MDKNTQTAIFSKNGRVIITHDHLIGTQILSPQEAKEMAKALLKSSEEAEMHNQVRLN